MKAIKAKKVGPAKAVPEKSQGTPKKAPVKAEKK